MVLFVTDANGTWWTSRLRSLRAMQAGPGSPCTIVTQLASSSPAAMRLDKRISCPRSLGWKRVRLWTRCFRRPENSSLQYAFYARLDGFKINDIQSNGYAHSTRRSAAGPLPTPSKATSTTRHRNRNTCFLPESSTIVASSDALIEYAARRKRPDPHHGKPRPPRETIKWPDRLTEEHLPDSYHPPRGGPRKNRDGDFVDADGNTWRNPPSGERHGAPHWDVSGKDWKKRHPEKGGHNVPIRPPEPEAKPEPPGPE